MMRKIGRFDAYVPDRDLFNTILCMLSLRGDEKKFEAPLHKMHQFFYEKKVSHPELFEDVSFNNDPEFPYSSQIAEAFIRLQESGFVTRPNPSLDKYQIDIDFEQIEIPALGKKDVEKLEEIAKSFNDEFKESNENPCRVV